jgi:hypothetical protein
MELSSVRPAPDTPLIATVTALQLPPALMPEPTATPDPGPTDIPCMVSFAATEAPANLQSFLDLPASAASAIADFFAAHQDESATTMVRSGPAYVLSVGGATIKMDYKALAAALKEGKLSPSSPLGASLLVFDVASRSQLPQGGLRAILGQMRQALADGQSAQQALQHGYHNVVLATQVEAYARHKDGLARDSRPSGPPSEAQQPFDQAVADFQTAYGRSRENGDYAAAFDALQEVIRLGPQGRSDKLAEDLAVPEDQGVVAEILDEVKDALLDAIDGAAGDGTTPPDGPNRAEVTALKDAEKASKRGAFLRRMQRDDPVLAKALARTEKHAEAVEFSASTLAQRSHGELQRTFRDVASGFTQWQADNRSKSQFDADYTRSTIDYMMLLDRFADGLEALKEGRQPKNRSTMLPPDAVDQPAVLASVIEAIALRLAEAAAPGPHLPEGAPGQQADLIAESLRAIIAACRTAS